VGVFKFKKFSLCDDRATMKVGTDAVLLGAWANVHGAKTILDIGTGSGIIALMMAQRTGPETKIDAVELMKEDAQQASENFLHSPWPNKISVSNARIQDFYPGIKYDIIICNPPFFSKSLLSPAEARSKVRHDTSLTSGELIDASIRLLSPTGKLSIILPSAESERFVPGARSKKLFLHRTTAFFARAGKPPERSLLEFGFVSVPVRKDTLTLYQSKDRWTDEYRSLTGDFYLDR
jgi:tRNA1Val (adenine37-N6)-methyltransferase